MSVAFYKDKWNEKHLHGLGLNERQIKAVMYVKEQGKITNSDYQRLNNVSERTALRDLDDLIKKEVIQKKVKRRGPIINWFHDGYMTVIWRIWRKNGR